jgi:Ca2+-transporting ATPase
MLFAAILGLPVPLTALQILWINLVTDGLPALALAVEAPEPNLMSRPPRAPDAPLISWNGGRLMLMHGLLIAISSLGAFLVAWNVAPGDLATAQLTTFCVTAFAQLFFAMSCRSRRLTWPQLGWFTNVPLLAAVTISGLLQLIVTMLLALREESQAAILDPRICIPAALLSLLPVTVFEAAKLAYSLRHRAASGDSTPAEPTGEPTTDRADRADDMR